MKKLVHEFLFTPEDLARVSELAAAVGMSETTAGILYARGMDTAEKVATFLRPSADNFLDPFLLKGMREAVGLIERAREEGWRVAVYGDYDADGIGACAVLSRALSEYGIEPYLFVPERRDGYGLSVRAIDSIFDEFLPDLVITVDCGISNRKEVEYIKESGAYVIVTDHHELPDELPDCIIVNPKLGGDYPNDNLCGAGVALKLAQALIGEKANALADFAALSTVADSVPLMGENRDIVAAGLRLAVTSPRPAIAALLGGKAEITAQTLAYTVAPRLNAAGRMGDAKAALRMFTSEDEEEIDDLAARLNAYNTERQKSCDELYAAVSAQIAQEGPYGNVIMLAGEDWNAGFTGIVAARIAEEYARPALLFVRRGGFLKGSARSVERVNIFDALKHCSQYIEEFGGHSQAAGVNVSEENFERLKAALNDYIGETYAREDFEPVVVVAGRASGDFSTVAHELTALEPCGIGNRRPLFYVEAERVDAAPMKAGSPHLSMTFGGEEYVYFNGLKDLALLRSDLKKSIVFEYNVSHYRGKEYVKGFVRCVIYDGMSGSGIELDALEQAIGLLRTKARPAETAPPASINAFMEERIGACAYGLLAIVQDRATLRDYPALAGLGVDVFRPSSGSVSNAVLYAPEADCPLSAYREIVCLDFPAAPPLTGKARVLGARAETPAAFRKISCRREDLLAVFSELRYADGAFIGEGYAEAARLLALSVPYEQTVFALAVFEELGLITRTEGRLRIVRGKRTELTDSVVYREVSRMKGV